MVAGLYGDKEEVTIETEIKYRDGRIGKMKTPISIVQMEGG
jgi:hypothetical protein